MSIKGLHKLLFIVLMMLVIIALEVVSVYTICEAIFSKEIMKSLGSILMCLAIIYVDAIALFCINKKTNIIDKIIDWTYR